MARSVIAATCGFQADVIGQFVDAFLADHGGIHVGQEELLAPVGGRLHHHIDAGEQAAQMFGESRVGRCLCLR